MARRAGTGERSGGGRVASTTGAPGSDSSSAWEKWGPQGWTRRDGAEDHAGAPCDSWISFCPFLHPQVPLPAVAPPVKPSSRPLLLPNLLPAFQSQRSGLRSRTKARKALAWGPYSSIEASSLPAPPRTTLRGEREVGWGNSTSPPHQGRPRRCYTATPHSGLGKPFRSPSYSGQAVGGGGTWQDRGCKKMREGEQSAGFLAPGLTQ